MLKNLKMFFFTFFRCSKQEITFSGEKKKTDIKVQKYMLVVLAQISSIPNG